MEETGRAARGITGRPAPHSINQARGNQTSPINKADPRQQNKPEAMRPGFFCVCVMFCSLIGAGCTPTRFFPLYPAGSGPLLVCLRASIRAAFTCIYPGRPAGAGVILGCDKRINPWGDRQNAGVAQGTPVSTPKNKKAFHTRKGINAKRRFSI